MTLKVRFQYEYCHYTRKEAKELKKRGIRLDFDPDIKKYVPPSNYMDCYSEVTINNKKELKALAKKWDGFYVAKNGDVEVFLH